MSTRAFVGIINHDKSCEIIFTHWDGYPKHHGPILIHNYRTTKEVRALMASGNHECLGQFHFDGEPQGKSDTFDTVEEMLNYTKDSWVEYVYLWDTKHTRWLFSKVYGGIKFKSLSMKDCQ